MTDEVGGCIINTYKGQGGICVMHWSAYNTHFPSSPMPPADYAALASSGPRGKKVAVKPTNCISAAHQTAVLTCSTRRFYHRAISSITWYKDGRLVNYTASPRYSVKWGGRRLSIDMVTPREDDGVFTCVVEEMSGKVYGNSASVKVEGVCQYPAGSACTLCRYCSPH